MSLAERLKLARIQLGWTRKEAGDHARVDLNLIYLYETGRRNPSTLALHGLAALYGKSVDWFYEEGGGESVALPERLKEARLQKGLTLEAVASALDSSYTTIWRYEAGQRRPSGPTLYALATIYQRPVEWFFSEEDAEKEPSGYSSETSPTPGPQYQEENESPVPDVALDRLGLLAGVLASFARDQDVSMDYLVGLTDDPTPWSQRQNVARAPTDEVPESRVDFEGGNDGPSGRRPVEVLEVASAAGGGAEVYDETPVGLLWFRSDWLNRHGIDPQESNIISVQGESMEPTLPDGCSILVDKNRRTLGEGRIYVMRTNDGLVVKRVGEDEDGCWQMLSDNPAWSPVPLVEETEIIGEVRWLGRTL